MCIRDRYKYTQSQLIHPKPKHILCVGYFALNVFSPRHQPSLARLIPLIPAVSTLSRPQLKNAVQACVELSPQADCPSSLHGPIGNWDVSNITTMAYLFSYATQFIGNISSWDVSRVEDMSRMFLCARKFDGDISKWDVSQVTSMSNMFNLSLIHI